MNIAACASFKLHIYVRCWASFTDGADDVKDVGSVGNDFLRESPTAACRDFQLTTAGAPPPPWALLKTLVL
jgi:hypothetical protein